MATPSSLKYYHAPLQGSERGWFKIFKRIKVAKIPNPKIVQVSIFLRTIVLIEEMLKTFRIFWEELYKF